MKLTTIFGLGLIISGVQTAQAQSAEGGNVNCCPGVDATGQLTDPCFENYQRGMIRAEAFGLLGEFKTLVSEIYANNGTWPVAGDPQYVSAPTSYARNWISRFDLLANGVLAVTLNREAGRGSIWLYPIVSTDPKVPIYWQCRSPDRPLIGQLVPACVYSGL